MPDKDEYPTDEELIFIEKYDLAKQPLSDLINQIRRIWNWPDWGFKYRGGWLVLHTGGWSGNESIIDSLQKNFIFWTMFWKVSRVGGHYWFHMENLKSRGIKT